MATSIAMATTSSSIAFRFLIIISISSIVFLCNLFVTLRFDVTSITAIIVTDAGGTVGCIVHLHNIGIGGTQTCGKASEIQVSYFLINMTLEVGNGEVIDEGHLRLNSIPKGLIEKASSIEYNEFIDIDGFTDLGQALY